jgi:hypothetical protein
VTRKPRKPWKYTEKGLLVIKINPKMPKIIRLDCRISISFLKKLNCKKNENNNKFVIYKLAIFSKIFPTFLVENKSLARIPILYSKSQNQMISIRLRADPILSRAWHRTDLF